MKRFGGLVAVDKVSLNLEQGKIYGIIGPNGSGKTTLLNLITGVLKPNGGHIFFEDKEISGKPLHAIANMGIGRTFQIPRTFPDLTIRENVLLCSKESDGAKGEESVREILDLLDLTSLADRKGANLGYGLKKLVELSRVMALNPELIFLDEPLSGLDLPMIKRITTYIRTLNKEFKKTVVIIEHNLEELMLLTDYTFVLHHGQKIEEGDPEKIRSSKTILNVYFGV